VVRELVGEEVETGGHFGKLSVTAYNSKRTFFGLARSARSFLQNRLGAGARAGASALFSLDLGLLGQNRPSTVLSFSFFFSAEL
jgi:hypothetical protein